MSAVVEVQNVSVVFGSGRQAVEAVRDLSLVAARGEFISIIGPSGSGKTTLLRIIGDLLEPSSGAVRVDGLTADEARRRGRFSYVFQNPVLVLCQKSADLKRERFRRSRGGHGCGLWPTSGMRTGVRCGR